MTELHTTEVTELVLETCRRCEGTGKVGFIAKDASQVFREFCGRPMMMTSARAHQRFGSHFVDPIISGLANELMKHHMHDVPCPDCQDG